MTVEEITTALMVGAVAFLITWRHTPWVMRRLAKAGFKAKDMYKEGTPEIPTKGGIAQVLAGVIAVLGLPVLAVAISSLAEVFLGYDVNSRLFNGSAVDSLAILVVLIYAMFGLADDFLRFSHPVKLIIPLVGALPLTRAIEAMDWVTPLGNVPLSGTYTLWGVSPVMWTLLATFVVLPVYIMVVTNLVNMHSGFNGLQTGLSMILLSGFTVKMLIDGRDLMVVSPVFAGVCAGFLVYNRYPARVFEGNVGALAVGAAIGCVIVANGYYMAGIVALMPHILNFVQYFYWRARRRLDPSDQRFKAVKFGRLGPDGVIQVPNRLTLKWVLPSLFPLGERGATVAMWLLTALCMGVAVFIPF